MEIKNVTNEVKNKYPKINQVSKKNITNSIPSKWLKLGASSLVLAMMMKHNVFATAVDDPSTFVPAETAIAGAVQNLAIENIKIIAYPTIISAVIFIITGLNIMISKIKSKKQSEPKKVKKWIKVMFIISIILFILSMILSILYGLIIINTKLV